MATEKLEIIVGADVQDVVKKLDQIEKVAKTTTQKTAAAFEAPTKALEKVAVKAFDADKAFKEAMERISASVDKNVATAISSFDSLEKNIVSIQKPVKSLQDKFREFGGLASNNAAKGLEAIGKASSNTSKELPNLNKATGQANTALTNFGRVVQDAPFGILGIANNIDPLISSFQSLKRETGSSGSAFKALGSALLGPAGIAIGLSAVTSLLIAFGPQIKEAVFGVNDFAKAIDEAAEGAAKDAIKVNVLTEAIKSGTLTAKQQTEAQNQLIKINPQFKGAFEGGAVSVDKLNKALGDTNNKLLEQIKISAATNILQKEFEKLAASVAQGGQTTFFEKFTSGISGALKTAAIPQLGFQVSEAGKKFKDLTESQSEIENFGKRINEVFNSIGITFGQYVDTNEKVLKSTNKNTEGFRKQVEQIRILAAEAAKVRAELNAFNADPTIKLAPKPQQGIDINRADRTSSLVLTPEALKRQSEYQTQLDAINEKLALQRELVATISGTINNGIAAGIDQFFNALANNQDPFEALQQSVKRLVVELAAAVVKMLVLKALAAAFTSGGSLAGGGLLSGAGGGGGGALDLLLRGDLLSGAIGRNSTRRRNFP